MHIYIHLIQGLALFLEITDHALSLFSWEPGNHNHSCAALQIYIDNSHWLTLLLNQIKMGLSKTKTKQILRLVCLLGEVTYDGLVSMYYSASRVLEPPVGAKTPALCCSPPHHLITPRTNRIPQV